MNCNECGTLLHALVDGELDAGHASEVERHVATCTRCAAELQSLQDLRGAMAAADLRYRAPAHLRAAIEARLPPAHAARPNRRAMLKGFAAGAAASAALAASLALIVTRNAQESRLYAEVVSAHLRSLQADHLTDVLSTDQHTVKPWFNGRIDIAPPVADLAAQGFTLIGGRLDYIDGKPVAVIVYRRRIHVINVFVSQASDHERRAARIDTVQGFNIRSWTDQGLELLAVSDLNADELREFGDKFDAAMHAAAGN